MRWTKTPRLPYITDVVVESNSFCIKSLFTNPLACERYHVCHGLFRPEHFGVNAVFPASFPYFLQPLLVVGPSPAHEKPHVRVFQRSSVLFYCGAYSFERGGDVREICDRPAYNHCLFGCVALLYELEQQAGVFESFLFGGVARILAVVAELFSKPVVSCSVCENDARASACNQKPQRRVLVEYRQFERAARALVQDFDFIFLFGFRRFERVFERNAVPQLAFRERLVRVEPRYGSQNINLAASDCERVEL